MMGKLRRSMLFLPGSSQKMIEKAAKSEADSIIIDLEDGVSPNQKINARHLATEALKSLDFGHRERTIRINPLDSPFGRDDLFLVIQGVPDAIVIPKVNCPEDVLKVDRLLTQAEEQARLPLQGIDLILLMETPAAIVNAVKIAGCCPRIKALIFGAADYSRETRGRITRERLELLYPLNQLLLAARIANIDVIDSPHFAIDDIEGLTQQAERAAALGYDGKAVIHPKQIEPVNRVFTPSLEEVAQAKKIIEAFEKAKQEGIGVIALEGQMIENVHVAIAQRTLWVAKKAGLISS
jgi:citrate lyase subunit beta/citryl-CoA lyase